MWKLLCGSSHPPGGASHPALFDGIRGQRCNFHIPHHTKDRYLFVVTLYKMCSSTYLCLSLQLGLKKYDVYTVKLCLEVANTGWSCKKKQRDKTFLNQKFIQIVFAILLEQCLKFQPSWTVCYVDNFLFQRRRIFFAISACMATSPSLIICSACMKIVCMWNMVCSVNIVCVSFMSSYRMKIFCEQCWPDMDLNVWMWKLLDGCESSPYLLKVIAIIHILIFWHQFSIYHIYCLQTTFIILLVT